MLIAKIALGYYDTNLKFLFINVVLNIVVMMLVLWKFTAVIEKFRNKKMFVFGIVFAVGYFVMVYLWYNNGMFWVIENMLFLWQIGYSVVRGGEGGLEISLVFVILLSRIPLLAVITSEDNIFKFTPNHLLNKFIIATIVFHLIVIFFQKKKGGRFFTPVSFIPDYYNYMR